MERSDEKKVYYDPTAAGVLKMARSMRGSVDENLENMLRYGIPEVDQATYGINVIKGDVVEIKGEKKNRKTTLLFNYDISIVGQLVKRNEWLCNDVLESGMPPPAYVDCYIAIIATRLLMKKEYGSDRLKWPRITDIAMYEPDLYKQMRFSQDFFYYEKPNNYQQQFIDEAEAIFERLPITIYGIKKDQGESRNFTSTLERWHKLYHGDFVMEHEDGYTIDLRGKPHRIFTLDHVQQVRGYGSDKYSQAEEVAEGLATFVGEHPGSAVIFLSQIGEGQLAEERRNPKFKAGSKGGGAYEAEANVVFRVRYDDETDPGDLEISISESRKKKSPTVYQPIDPESGSFLGAARVCEFKDKK